MTWHRLEHIRSEVNKLEKLKNSQRMRQITQQPPSQHQNNVQNFAGTHSPVTVQNQQPNTNVVQPSQPTPQMPINPQAAAASNQYPQQFPLQQQSHQSPNRST